MSESCKNNDQAPSMCKRSSKLEQCKTQSQKSSSCPPKPSAIELKMDERFANSITIVHSLLHLIPSAKRGILEKWMKKLYSLNTCLSDRETRQDYLWMLLVQLSHGTVTLPFVNDPPEGKLKPISNSPTDSKIYEEVLEAAINRSKFDELSAPITNNLEPEMSRINLCLSKDKKMCKKCKPIDFLQQQPEPSFGFIAYGSCFSNQD